jgi:iron complex outermembrane receptor protein
MIKMTAVDGVASTLLTTAIQSNALIFPRVIISDEILSSILMQMIARSAWAARTAGSRPSYHREVSCSEHGSRPGLKRQFTMMILRLGYSRIMSIGRRTLVDPWCRLSGAADRRRIALATWLHFAAVLSATSHAQENPATQLDLPRIVVVGTTPLPGIGLPPEQVPANVQTLSASELHNAHAQDVGGALSRGIGSSNINDTQGNPFLVDLTFRGFTASPVLGTPQGLSVFIDGVRANEALGDTVNWDLVPLNAIANVAVMPGSNPVFGLNTLGGAVSLTTKSGLEFPGTALGVTGGSFGRKVLTLETGGHGQSFDYFLAGNVFDQSGWADHSPSRVRQVFAKAGYQDSVTDVDLSFTSADNRLEGAQTLPRSWLDTPTQVYSWPDIQTDRLESVNLKASYYLAQGLLLAADAYYRHLTTTAFNSNLSNNFDPTLPAGAGNLPASNTLNAIDERRPGGSLQLTYQGEVAKHRNTMSLGVSIDRGRAEFTQSSQDAPLSADRGTLSGLTPVVTTVLRSTSAYRGLYATNTFAVNRRTYWTVSGRYNRATIDLVDQLGTALNGHHLYSHFDPATGLTFNPSPTLTTYIAFNEGLRVPTTVELSCADPKAPCSLPNVFSSDPDLRPVISRTWEVGARGHMGAFDWRIAGFDTELQDDIEFINSGGGAVSAGYFRNVGQTRRLGVETAVDAHLAALTVRAQLSYVDATYRTPFILNNPNNSSAMPLACGTCKDIAVMPGNRIAGVPKSILKVNVDYQFSSQWASGATLTGQSGVYARGDENNQDAGGQVPGFLVVDLESRYRPAPRWGISLRIDNVFDHRYSTYGQLGQNRFMGPGQTFDYTGTLWQAEQFRSLAAPRGVWLIASYSTGGGDDH